MSISSRLEDVPRSLRVAIGGATMLFVLPLVFFTASGAWRAIGWRTVATDRKLYARGYTLGYSLQRPVCCRDDILLTLTGPDFSIQFQSPGTTLNRLVEQRWFCDDRV